MSRPQRFGRFWLHERIGRGGMADVFRASLGERADAHSLEFVIKRMHPHLVGDAHHVEMFLVEEYVQGLLSHPNVVRMFESGKHEGAPYIAMEYVRGADLDTLLDRLHARRLAVPLDIAFFVTQSLLKALDYVHRAVASQSGKPMEMIHRDVSPANIYVALNGEVKLGDFGVARVNLLEDDKQRWIKGKVAYIPPDVLAGAPFTQAWDIWGASVCLFEMLTNRRYWGEASEAEILARAKAGHFPDADPGPEHDRRVRKLLTDALNPKPERRPTTAGELYRELRLTASAMGLAPSQETTARFVLASLGNIERMSSGHDAPMRDWLTGAASERYLGEMLETEISRARRYHHVFSLLSFDIDGFAKVNDEVGRAAGDDLLCALVSKFFPNVASLRSCDLVARVAADSFCIVLPETPEAGAMVVAERIRRCFAAQDWSELVPKLTRRLTCTLSVAAFPTHAEDAVGLVASATAAHERAKKLGQNRVEVAFGVVASSHHATRLATPQPINAAAPLELTFRGEEELARAYATDIDGGGLRIRLREGPPLESAVRLALRLGGSEQAHLVDARVCWRGKDDLVAFQFIDASHELLETLDTLSWRHREPLERI